MEPSTCFRAACLTGLLLMLAAPLAAAAPAATALAPSAPAPRLEEGDFTAEELEQLVAPVALYPDALLSQVLMAATYPLEIVQAARWLDEHADLPGDELELLLQDELWDPSVKALCAFPDVLALMDENLDWAQDLGDAVLGQQDEVLDAVQRMRALALEAGTLETSDEQEVEVVDGTTTIVSTTEVVYVPVYRPRWVYGSWTCRHWHYPTLYADIEVRSVSYHARGRWRPRLWGGCDWRRRHITCHPDRYDAFRRRTVRDGGLATTLPAEGGRWAHDPHHRRNVGYRHREVAERHAPERRSVSDRRARGRRDDRVSTADRDRPRSTTRESRSTTRESRSTTRERRSSGRSTTRTTRSRSGTRSSALSGSGSASLDRRASDRGRASSSRSTGRTRTTGRARVGGRRG